MTPFEKACQVYLREPCARTFGEDLHAHLLRGTVISTPAFFAMYRPVDSRADPEDIVNPWHNSWGREPDCWHCYLLSGCVASFLLSEVSEMPYCSFERGNRLRIHPWSYVRRLALRSSL